MRTLLGFHDVLALDTEMLPYERSVTDMARVEREAWAHESVLCLAPRSYWQHLSGAASWVRPLAGLGIGQQKAALKRLLLDASSLALSSGQSS